METQTVQAASQFTFNFVLNAATFVLVAGIVFHGGKFIGEVRTMLDTHDARLRALEDKKTPLNV